MNEIGLHSSNTTSGIFLSNIFLDEYMPQANGDFVKIYLYLVRCFHSRDVSCSVCRIADKFEHTENDVIRALKYWEKMGLLRLEYDENGSLSGIYLLEIKPKDTPEPSDDRSAPLTPDREASSDKSTGLSAVKTVPREVQKAEYSQDDIRRFSEKNEIKELFFIIENYLKRTLSPTDINTILFWYDSLHFSTDLIEYLVEYCVMRNHTSIRYMDKVAISWAEVDISTVEQAKKTSTLHSQANFAVMKALGIKGRNLVELETKMVEKWTQEYGFTLDIITEACKRTITATHQPSFEYTDKILSNWHKGEVKHLDDIHKIDEKYQKNKANLSAQRRNTGDNKFTSFSQRTYNYDQLEKQLLSRSKN